MWDAEDPMQIFLDPTNKTPLNPYDPSHALGRDL